MGIHLYDGVPAEDLNASRLTSEGKGYTLDHPGELLVDMRYKGEGRSGANSQGWERSSPYYFKELQKRHPEFFSRKNHLRIEAGRSPVVDRQFASHFPQYKEYTGETLVHHHIGQDGQAVALPQSIHKGYGEIHTVEHDLGITEKAQGFSQSCEAACQKDPSLYGRLSGQFRSIQAEKEKRENAFASSPENKAADQYRENAFTPARPMEGYGPQSSRDNAITASASTQAKDLAGASHGQTAEHAR